MPTFKFSQAHNVLSWAWIAGAVVMHGGILATYFLFNWIPVSRSPANGPAVSLDLMCWITGAIAVCMVLLLGLYVFASGVWGAFRVWWWPETTVYDGEKHVPRLLSCFVIFFLVFHAVNWGLLCLNALIVNGYFTRDGLPTTNVSTLPGVDLTDPTKLSFDNVVRYYTLLGRLENAVGYFLLSMFPSVVAVFFAFEPYINPMRMFKALGISVDGKSDPV